MSALYYAFLMLRLEQCFKTSYSVMDNMVVGFVITRVNKWKRFGHCVGMKEMPTQNARRYVKTCKKATVSGKPAKECQSVVPLTKF